MGWKRKETEKHNVNIMVHRRPNELKKKYKFQKFVLNVHWVFEHNFCQFTVLKEMLSSLCTIMYQKNLKWYKQIV